jgi:senataxin
MSTYRRPVTAGRHRQGNCPKDYPGRFEQEVLNGGLWYAPQCGALPGGLSTSIPDEFESIDEYIRVFDPLVLEEGKESVRSSWVEQCQGEHGMYVEIRGLEEISHTNRQVGSMPVTKWNKITIGVKKEDRRGDLARICTANVVVVLSSKKPSASMTCVGDWTGGANKGEDHVSDKEYLIAGMCQRIGKDGVVRVKIHPVCHQHMGYDTNNTETCPACVQSLYKLRNSVGQKEWWITPTEMLVSCEREFTALHSVRGVESSLMKYILKPSLLVSMGDVYKNDIKRREMWPKEAQHKGFIQHLKSKYDYKQLEAIEMTACQLTSRSNAKTNVLPFVLIQGPPGTGKTHTVLGVLNMWHLTAFQQYYSLMMQQIIEKAMQTGSGLGSLSQILGLGGKKPRILVCTPSNAACDELMWRVMLHGFCDGSGQTYKPNIIRIGGDAAVNHKVKDRFLNTLVCRYSSMSEGEWQNAYQEATFMFQSKEREGRVLEASISKSDSNRDLNKIAHSLVDISQALDRLSKQIEKLQACRPLVLGQKDGAIGRRAINELETLLLAEAEMVFSTLSSTQRKIFKDASSRAPFHTVLIDEAGQASEVATLQPITAGAKSVVLVGDPQQLPATIKSEAARAVEMERSLFERLQAKGCPVALLSVQYRMHPEIRRFPSYHFYKNKLEDAQEVLKMAPEPYHASKYLGPYCIFDVARGQEKRGKSGASLSNAKEAELAACLYLKLQQELKGCLDKKHVSIAVITPYREQKACLRATFETLCGTDSLRKVAIETVDSYQGRQVDIVILSCVRAGSSGGLGFVTDVRRMNVAITRARRSLWILGALSTLRANKEWNALIRYAKI